MEVNASMEERAKETQTPSTQKLGKKREASASMKERAKARRAFVFTIDAIVAALVAGLLLAALVLSFNNAEAELSPVVTLRQTGEDVLAAMDKQGALKAVFTQSDADARANITSFLNSVLPRQVAANITVEIFEYDAGSSCSASCRIDGTAPVNSFCTCRRLVNNTAAPCGNASGECRQMSRARRMFYSFVGGGDRLGMATLELWSR